MRRAACWCDQLSRKFVAGKVGRVRNCNRVTTPKLPAPPPRNAQNKSAWWRASHSTIWPSARTISALSRLSDVRPNMRPRIPRPPPSVSPAIPTEGHDPPGIVTPALPSASYSSPSRAPAPILAYPSATSTERIGETSITIPSPADRLAKQCPPLRDRGLTPERTAKRSTSTTSLALEQKTTASGCESWKRAKKGLRANSYAAEPESTTSPSIAACSAGQSAANGPRPLSQAGRRQLAGPFLEDLVESIGELLPVGAPAAVAAG